MIFEPASSHLRPLAAAPLTALETLSVAPEGDGLRVRAAKRVLSEDPYMDGHFPGFPIYPGVFVLETVLQAVARAVGRSLALGRVRSMRFTAPLLAGDALELTALVRPGPGDGVMSVRASCRRRDGVDAASLTLELRTDG
ncbi:MAG: 3-hydroxyacyl-ACP dehydratase FabZ family protein [Solirubrobacteraceae bacterium]